MRNLFRRVVPLHQGIQHLQSGLPEHVAQHDAQLHTSLLPNALYAVPLVDRATDQLLAPPGQVPQLAHRPLWD